MTEAYNPLLDRECVRVLLVQKGYDPAAVIANADQCLTHLRMNGVLYRTELVRMLDAEDVKHELMDIYRTNLGRAEGQLDPVAICCWGPKLWMQGTNNPRREIMGQYVRECVDQHAEAVKHRAALVASLQPTPDPAKVVSMRGRRGKKRGPSKRRPS